MIQKPNDFFVGVVDFFAILAPGAVLVFLLLDPGAALFGRVFPPLATETAQWFAFGIASFIAGHVLHHLGGLVLDWGYDRIFVKSKRKCGKERRLTKTEELMKNTQREDAGMSNAFCGPVPIFGYTVPRLRARSTALRRIPSSFEVLRL